MTLFGSVCFPPPPSALRYSFVSKAERLTPAIRRCLSLPHSLVSPRSCLALQRAASDDLNWKMATNLKIVSHSLFHSPPTGIGIQAYQFKGSKPSVKDLKWWFRFSEKGARFQSLVPVSLCGAGPAFSPLLLDRASFVVRQRDFDLLHARPDELVYCDFAVPVLVHLFERRLGEKILKKERRERCQVGEGETNVAMWTSYS